MFRHVILYMFKGAPCLDYYMKKHEDIFGQTLCKTLNKTVNTGSGKLIQSNLDQLVDNGLKNGLGKKHCMV